MQATTLPLGTVSQLHLSVGGGSRVIKELTKLCPCLHVAETGAARGGRLLNPLLLLLLITVNLAEMYVISRA